MKKLVLIAVGLLAMLALASPASAATDRNHDRLPDRWERAHHLSLKVKQAKRDQDRDGLNNRGEYRAKTDPRDDDSDNDGIEDGDENAGTIKSFEGGVLTITLAGGGELSAKVDAGTEIECHSSYARTTSEGDEDSDEDRSGSDDGPNHDAGEHPGDDEDGDDVHDDEGDDEEDRCGTEALTAGTKVHEAELKATVSGKRWTELELIK